MNSLYALVCCSLLLQGDGTAVPSSPDLLPAVQRTPFAAPEPAVQSTAQPVIQPTTQPAVQPPALVSSAANNAKQLTFPLGVLMLPKHHHIALPATVSAELKSLNTEKRDAAGNIFRDSDGNPVMMPVTRGMNVVKGQVLGKLDDQDMQGTLIINQAELDLARAELGKNIEKEHAIHGANVAYAEYLAKSEANKHNTGVPVFTAMDIRRAELAYREADSYLKLQMYNLEEVASRKVIVQESRVEQTKDQIRHRQLIAPIDGMVVEIHASEGEWVQEGHPVLEIMRLDTLYVQMAVNAAEYESSDLEGKQAVIRVPLANGRTETFQGVVVFCEPKVDTSQKFRVFIEVQNRRAGNYWLLRPGREGVEVVIPL